MFRYCDVGDVTTVVCRAMEEQRNQITLLMDSKFSFAVRFPFSPSNIHLDELDIPEQYAGLEEFVRKV